MSLDPRTIELLQRGFRARQAGRLDEARSALMQVLQRVPEQVDALYLLGEIAQAQGDLPLAGQWLGRSVRSHADQPLAWSRLGEVQESLGQPDEAMASYRQAVRCKPDHAPAHFNLARLLVLAARPDEAHEALRLTLATTTATHPLRALALQLRAQLEQAAQAPAAALASLDEALAIAPDRAALHHNRGAVLNQLSRPAMALAAIERAAQLGLDIADLHYNRGNSLQALGRGAEAVVAYQEALARQPLHELALYDVARLRWRMGDADFDAELRHAAIAEPSSALVPGIVGRLMLRAERADAAEQAFARACELDDVQAGYFDGLGQALSRLGRHDEAVVAHRRAVALSPALAASHVGLAAACLQAGQLPQAQAAAQAAVALDPLDQQSWATLGLAWRASGDARDAWLNDYEAHVQSYELDPPSGFADLAAFNNELAAVLDEWHHDTHAPIDQTLRHGSQTHGNLFERGIALVGALKQCLAKAIDRYLAHLAALPPDPQHPLLSRLTGGWRFSDSWSSRLQSGGFHTRHVHPHGWISSVYYVALPAVVGSGDPDAQAGWLTFGQPELEVPGRPLAVQRSVRPAVGRLVLFPSFMWHGTRPFEDTKPRLTVAFDVLPRP